MKLQQQEFPAEIKILEKVALSTMGVDGGSIEEHILITLGTPHTEHEFFLGALGTQHPLEKRAGCSDRLKTQVHKILTSGAQEWEKTFTLPKRSQD